MVQDYKKLAEHIFEKVAPYRIESVTHCVTRLRITLRHDGLNVNEVKSLPGVLGVMVSGNEYQIILGPGIVNHVYNEFIKLHNNQPNIELADKPDIHKITLQVKSENKAKRQSSIIPAVLSKFAKIFTPLIPAFIAAGILAGVAGILQSAFLSDNT
jgi:N-acetylmuramic acid-specific PTS system IIC component